MQPQAVPASDLSLSKVTSQKIFVSDDLNPDLYPVQAIARVSCKTSKFFTPIQCDLEPEINKPTSRKIVVPYNLPPDPSTDLASRKIVILSDLDPDLSAGLDFKGVIAQGFCGPFILNSSWRNFEKVDEDRKLSSKLWVRMAIYQNYIKYAVQKLNTLVWLHMSGYRKYTSSTYVFISSFVSLSKYEG